MSELKEIGIVDIRSEFPLLSREVYGKPLVYLDNAATTQKPQAVLEAIQQYYVQLNSNIHRGAHFLANEATAEFEEVRETIAQFIGANEKEEIIFTGGTTDGINLVASSYGRKFLKTGDEILLTELEHHSNIVPWQLIAQEKGAVIKVLPILDNGEWDLSQLDFLLTKRTKMVAVNQVSNALGTVNPVELLIAKAHAVGAVVLVDGAQSVSHMRVDVKKMNCDFFTFSGHKLYGPMGVGVLFGKRELLEQMPPYRGGGEMIKIVAFEETTFNDLPYKFEAGTPNVEGVLGLGAAINFVNSIGIESISKHESALLAYATKRVGEIEGLRLYGTSKHKAAVLSFVVDGIHPYDIGTLLDKQGIAVRTGHHCTQPLMARLGISGTVRASFAMYNTKEEVDLFVKALQKAIQMLKA